MSDALDDSDGQACAFLALAELPVARIGMGLADRVMRSISCQGVLERVRFDVAQ